MKIHYYSDEELDFLRNFAYGHSYKEVTDAINAEFGLSLGVNQIRSCLKNHKITTGRTGKFEKGHVPANKGKHPPTKGKMAETQFKKGHTPKNRKPIGTVCIRHNYRRGQKYVYEKVAEPNVWRMKHILEWEKHHGPVPQGKAIIFVDGDTTNTDISNLIMVDRSQLVVMNRWNLKGSNRELMEAAANTAALKISISRAKKSRKERRKSRDDTGD